MLKGRGSYGTKEFLDQKLPTDAELPLPPFIAMQSITNGPAEKETESSSVRRRSRGQFKMAIALLPWLRFSNVARGLWPTLLPDIT
jgi:hypothetical protein